MKNMFIKIKKSTDWDFGPGVELHLLEIDPDGRVIRIIEIDSEDKIIKASPTADDQYGAIDHPPLSMDSNWSEWEISPAEFETYWNRIKLDIDTNIKSVSWPAIVVDAKESEWPFGSFELVFVESLEKWFSDGYLCDAHAWSPGAILIDCNYHKYRIENISFESEKWIWRLLGVKSYTNAIKDTGTLSSREEVTWLVTNFLSYIGHPKESYESVVKSTPEEGFVAAIVTFGRRISQDRLNELRLKIATQARRYYANEITYNDFLDVIPEQDLDDVPGFLPDELIDELVDLIECAPKNGGIFGTTSKEYKDYSKQLFELIEKLEQEST
jgi:hypothetical protein